MKTRTIGILVATLLAACGPSDMSQDEVKKNLFSGDGVLGGHDFGDSWEEIKKGHAEVFEVRDDDFKQLRRKVHDNAGSNGYFIGFRLDGEGKVEAIDASINGSEQNAVVVRKVLDDAIAHFDAMVGADAGGCASSGGGGNSSNCSWSKPGKPSVTIMYSEGSDPIRGSIHIDVTAPKATP